MARGLKKHLNRLNAPRHWMLDKLGGAFAPKPSSEPHKSLGMLATHVMVDGKVRIGKIYPAGFTDVVSIPKTNEDFRLLVFVFMPSRVMKPSSSFARFDPSSLARRALHTSILMMGVLSATQIL
ncbi:hypothetical protein CRYUN_Cryun40dG0038900 [Craigia yunnanensis]